MEHAWSEVELAMPCVDAGLAVRRRLLGLGWPTHHEEEVRTKDGRRLAIAFGTTTPFGGSTLESLVRRGAASVAFFVRMEELDARRTKVQIYAGGTEGWAGLDYGRNKGVVQRFFEGLGDDDLPHR